MATGDSDDLLRRVKATIPFYWFAYVAPVRDAVLGGLSDSAAWCYSWITYARQQSRIGTSTGPFIDLIAWDFFGTRFKRRPNEQDDNFLPRILPEILRPRVTRAGTDKMLFDLTGYHPIIVEPWHPGDCGAYGVGAWGGVCGYGVAGLYGSLLLPDQILVTAFRPPGAGIPNVDGYGGSIGGYGVGAIEYADLGDVAGPVTDAEIYQRTADVVAAGVTAWVLIINPGTATAAEDDQATLPILM